MFRRHRIGTPGRVGHIYVFVKALGINRTRLTCAAMALAAVLFALWLNRAPMEAWVGHVVAWCRLAGPWVFFGAMAVLPVFGFSLFAFVASAGPVFGPVLGISHVIAYGLLALAVNVSLSYVLAVGALRPAAERVVAWFGFQLPDSSEFGSWEIALMVRLLPGPPFGLQSCALGLANIPFGAYLATSLAVPAMYYAGVVILSSGLAGKNIWAAVLAGCFLILVACAVHRLRRKLELRWRLSAATVPGRG